MFTQKSLHNDGKQGASVQSRSVTVHGMDQDFMLMGNEGHLCRTEALWCMACLCHQGGSKCGLYSVAFVQQDSME